jgi:hypothetical protein
MADTEKPETIVSSLKIKTSKLVMSCLLLVIGKRQITRTNSKSPRTIFGRWHRNCLLLMGASCSQATCSQLEMVKQWSQTVWLERG